MTAQMASRGFSVLEMLVSVSLTLAVTAVIVRALNVAQGTLQTDPERADMQQRLRVAEDTLYQDLLMVGNGAYAGKSTGPLTYFFAPVLPYRLGLRQSDRPGTAKTNAITLLYVPPTSAQATIQQSLAAQSGAVTINPEPACGFADAACGFAAGLNVLVFDKLGFYDLFTVTDVTPPVLELQHDFLDTAHIYAPGSKIVQILSRAYYLKTDDVSRTYQLMRYDGGSGNDVPVVDHVVGLHFDLYGDPQAPVLRKPLLDPKGPWTSYGPIPPDLGVTATEYPPGENCVFLRDGDGGVVPRLNALGSGPALVALDPSRLTDGPWCPDGSNPNRFDADLLRVRKVVATLRVESAVDALRGPAGFLFSHAGLARAGDHLVPDREIRLAVSPRNLNLGR